MRAHVCNSPIAALFTIQLRRRAALLLKVCLGHRFFSFITLVVQVEQSVQYVAVCVFVWLCVRTVTFELTDL